MRCNALAALIVCGCLVICNVIDGVASDRGSFIGCYRQNLYLDRLNIFSGSVDECVNACAQQYYRYAVLDGNVCYCTNTIKETEVSADECDKPCTEKHDQFCGGSFSQSYHDTDVKVAGPPLNIRIVNHTDTSITVEWTAPEAQPEALARYVVRAKVLRQFGGSGSSTPMREWSVDRSDRVPQIECVDLHPGATYNISVTSHSDHHGDGGMGWIVGETEIGVPDLPPQPTVTERKEKTLSIDIPPIVNGNGPVTAVQVVVIYVDEELSQEFDEGLLKGYKQAVEDGTNYYITAELNNESAVRKFVIGNALSYGGFDNVPLVGNRHVHATLGIISTYKNVTRKRYALETTHEQHGEKTRPLTLSTEDDGGGLETTLYVACWLFGILLVLSIAGYGYLRLKMGPHLQRLPSDHHELTLQGPIVEVENNGGYQPDEFSRKSFDQKLNEILDQIELDKKFGRNNLVLDVNNVLANGQFGDVISGKVNGQPCQVHVVSDDMEPLDQSQFLKDLDTVRKFGPHKNVVDFYGVCQTANWLYLLFEHTPTTLKTMLIESRTPPTTNKHSFSSLSEAFVLRTLFELSTAMEYLHSYKFVHRKLCSHNVRMAADETAKVSCFGATPVDNHGKTVDMLRWSAPEVIRFQHHSERSDAWSFGCLIWECCSLGGTLYPSINSNDLITNIRAGIRADRVPFALDDVNQLMFNCWQLEPSERPTFADISFTLRQFLASPEHILSFKRQDGHLLPYYLPLLEIENTS